MTYFGAVFIRQCHQMTHGGERRLANVKWHFSKWQWKNLDFRANSADFLKSKNATSLMERGSTPLLPNDTLGRVKYRPKSVTYYLNDPLVLTKSLTSPKLTEIETSWFWNLNFEKWKPSEIAYPYYNPFKQNKNII